MSRSSSQWERCELADAYWFQEGPGVRQWQFQKQGIKLLNVANITTSGTIDLDKTNRYLSVEEVESKYKHFLVDEGDLIIASSGISFDADGFLRTRGAFVHKEHLPLCMNTSTIRFKCKEDISDLRFLKYWLDSNEFRTQISRFVTGSAQQNFGPSHLKEMSISLPPLPEQRRIAALLDKADKLRRTRRYAAQLSDTFLQAVFVRMFGDPRTNPMKWDVELVGDQIDSIRYGTGSPPEYQSEGIPFIRATNIKGGTVKPEGMVFISKKDAEKISKCEVKKGNLIIVRSGVNAGDCAVVPDIYDGAFAAYDLVVEVTHPRNVYYNQLINSIFGKAIIAPMTRRAGQPHLNAEQIQDLHFPLPPLALQEKFARIVQQFERLRAQQREAERQAEHLFQTLLHRAFGGEG